jgi:hypothetical protein
VKATSASLLYAPGTHQEITRWHEEVHRREMHASVPHMYYSPDWIAPPDYVQARPQTELAARGGEYVTLYFSDGDAAQLGTAIRAYADQTRGNYHPHQEVIWRGRMAITHARAREGWELTLDTVPLFANVGLAVQIDELAPGDATAYAAWSEQVYVPVLLRSTQLSGVFQMRPFGPEAAAVRLHLGFVEYGDPLAAFDALKSARAKAEGQQKALSPLARSIFFGMYVPVTPANYATYE